MAYNIPDILAGIVLCIFGWTTYWIGLHAVGTALGGMIGSMTGLGLAVMIGGSGGGSQWALPMAATGAVVGGVIGFFLIKRAHRFAFFLIGCISGAIAMLLGWPGLSSNVTALQNAPFIQAVCVVAGSLLLGALLAVFNRYLIIIATALLGTMLICVGAGHEKSAVAFIPIFVLSLILQGFLFHRYCAKPKKPGAGAPAPPGGGGHP
ncbi:MAG: hypothetical protein NTX50_28520 [Candidatus Sumerlaeota bacterium]|nr:hypothetical protein [Candidatus Sumerlaeota bacterium]